MRLGSEKVAHWTYSFDIRDEASREVVEGEFMVAGLTWNEKDC
jgi:hypothetical protein